MKAFVLILLQISITAFSEAYNPLLDPEICGNPKDYNIEHRKFSYSPSTVQTYKYSVDVRTFFNGTSNNESTIHIDGLAILTFISPSEGILDLSDVTLTENSENLTETSSSASLAFGAKITKSNLRFGFRDGVITELCPQPDEEVWVLNFKRGILSMMHNTMRRFDLDHTEIEDDVKGTCMTNYRVIGADNTSLLIEKTKNLASCSDRVKLYSVIQSSKLFDFQSAGQQEVVWKSTSKCNLSIDHNVYGKITCREKYLLQPLSNGQAGAATVVEQKLVLHDEKLINKKEEKREVFQRTSLSFDYTPSDKSTQNDIKVARTLIKKLCIQTNDKIRMNVSELISTSIQSLRMLSHPALTALYRHANMICRKGKTYFLNVLPYVSTGASVDLMKDIVLKEDVKETTLNEWMLSIAFIPQPEDIMIEAVAKILEFKNFTSNTALSISAVVHTYCKNNLSCTENEFVKIIITKFQDFIKNAVSHKNDSDYNHDEVLIAFKALSTIGVILNEFQYELYRVITNHNLNIDIRIAAIEAFRRLPCEDSRDFFEDIFRNNAEDVEIRIASYLQLMRCPNYLLIRTVEHCLKEEEVNQVGSFVWTHLKNLIKSSNPSRVEIQSLLSEKDLVKKFSSDFRKFSHNREGAVYFDAYNVGGSYDSNVIFSTSSYIPRSAMVNFTLDLFGQSINILEVYGRVEGLEHYIESLFGPKGKSREFVKDVKTNITSYVKQRVVRNTYSAQQMQSEVDKMTNFPNNFNEPKVMLGMKIFGNDIKYNSWNGYDEIKNTLKKFNPLEHIKMLLSGEEFRYNKTALILDSKLVVPTGTGLPLTLSLLGSSSVNVKFYGSLHAKDLSEKGKLEMTANIEPMVSVDITGEMGVDAYYLSSGIKLNARVGTETAIQSEIKIHGKKLVSIKMSLPKITNKIFEARTQLLVKQKNVDIPQSGLQENRNEYSICSWPVIEKTIGLIQCAEYSFVNASKSADVPQFLLAGPAGIDWHVNKTDPTARTYVFEYKWFQRQNISEISLTFDTPGSKIKRLLNANLTIDKHSQNLTMLLESHAGTVLARGKYRDTDEEKSLQIALDINNKKHFDASLTLKRHKKINGYTYAPKAHLEVNGERVLDLYGTVDYITKKDVAQYTVDLKFRTKRLDSRLFGYISKTQTSVGTDLYLDYRFTNMLQQRTSFKFTVGNKSKKNKVQVIATCEMSSTAYPHYSFNSNFTFQQIGSHMEMKAHLNQDNLSLLENEDKNKALSLKFILSSKSSLDGIQVVHIGAGIKRKVNNLDLHTEFEYRTSISTLDCKCVVKYGDNKQVSVTAQWVHPRITTLEVHAKLNITVPSFAPMVLDLQILQKESTDTDYNFDLKATWFSGISIQAIGVYQDKSSAVKSNHRVKMFIKSPNFKDVSLDLQFYRDNGLIVLKLQGDYEDRDYEFSIKHDYGKPEEVKSNVQIMYNSQVYSLNSLLYNGDYVKALVELHVGEMRNIDLSLLIHNREFHKAFSVDIKWDANRDPNQKLLIAANYTKFADFDCKSDLIVSYPGRTILGKYEIKIKGGHIDTLISLSWDDGKTLGLILNVIYDFENKFFLEVYSRINTPFDNWKIINVLSRIENEKEEYRVHGEFSRDSKKRVNVDFYGNYIYNGYDFKCTYSGSIYSSLDRIPNINATISHSQNKTHFDTKLYLMRNPEFVIDIDSHWKVQKNEKFTNVTGTVHCYTPFKGINKGFLISKIDLTADKYLKGVATLDMNHKKMLINVEGKFKKLMASLLVLNATTIDENYQFLFTLSREERKFATIISYPTGNIGTEVMLQIKSITNFNIKFYLATPIDFLQKALVVAKMQPKEADFRIGWNNMLLGLSGTWKYKSMIDFDHSYKIFTPLDDFEETGIVAKLIILKAGIDLEATIKAYKYKLGIKFLGKPNSRTLNELGDVGKIYGISKTQAVNTGGWEGSVEIDAVLFPTIKGNLDFYQEGTLYIFLSKLYLPHGIARISDVCDFIDILHMKNELTITTPYDNFKTIASNFQLEIESNIKYLVDFTLDREKPDQIIKSGIYGLYNVNRKGELAKTYNVTINIVTPFEKLKHFDLSGLLETEEKFSYVEVHGTKDSSSGWIEATTEFDNDITQITSSFEIRTPSIIIPEGHVKVRKLFSSSNNFVQIEAELPQNLKSQIFANCSWLIKSLYEFKAMTELNTPFIGMEHTIAGVDFILGDSESAFSTLVNIHPVKIDLNSTYVNNVLDANADLLFNSKRFPIILKCTTTRSSNQRLFSGDLIIRGQHYKIDGDATVIAKIPIRAFVKITPENQTDSIIFEYDIKKKQVNGYELLGDFQRYGIATHFKGYGVVKDKLNWEGNLEIIPSNPAEKASLHATMASAGNEINFEVSARTSITKLENPKCTISYLKEGIGSKISGKYQLTNASGSANISYIWKFLDNMYISAEGFFRNVEYDSYSSVLAFYRNPNKEFKLLSSGADFQIDKLLQVTANATIALPKKNDIKIDGHFKWPNYSKNLQSFFAKLNYGEHIEFIDYLIKYTNSSTNVYGSWGKLLLPNTNNFDGTINVKWNDSVYENTLNLKRLTNSLDAWYKLIRTKEGKSDELFTDVCYRNVNDRVNLIYRAFYPKDKSLVHATVDYFEVENMRGRLNLSMPYKYLNDSALDFTTRTTKTEYYRFGKLYLGNQTMFIEAKANNTEQNSEKSSKGEVTVEVPLTSKHNAFVEYEYHSSIPTTDGLCKVQYNGNQIAEGKFHSVSENTTEFSQKTMEAELQNNRAPIGARYVYKHSLPNQDPSVPYLDIKYIHLFNLQNRSKFNVSGELKSLTTNNSQEYNLQATHLNRTILLNSKYVSEHRKYKRYSRIELSPTTWLECNLKLNNRTTDDVYDVQDIIIDLFYPKRNFTGQLSYNLSEEITHGDASLVWDTDRKTAQAALDWRRLSPQNNLLEFRIKHPSFSRDVSFANKYGYYDDAIYSNLTIIYSEDPNEQFVMSAKVEDNSNVDTYNYTYLIFAEHIYTTLLLNTQGSFYCSSTKCGTIHTTDYRRSIVPLTKTKYVARINNDDNELELMKNNSDRIVYFYGTYAIHFPVYTAHVHSLNGSEDNAWNGRFIADLKSKVLSGEFNTTVDDSRNIYGTYGVYGIIPDARSASFDMWRNYDDKNISDVHYYLRLNHSRFITSKLYWRPELMNEFQRSLLDRVIKLHQNFLENINNTRHYIRAETMNAVSDTWENAKPYVKEFLDDLKNLSVIIEDVAVFKQFLNQSYHTNEFYIKDIYEAVTVLFDELSLKTHLQKLPKILQELWEIMGESGEKIKKNIIWISEQIKGAYNNSTNFLHEFVNGDPVEQLSKLLEKVIERYDDFIKNIHVALLQYMEYIWKQTYKLIVENWHQTLAALEPSFIKFIHYLETIAWSTGKDFLDFLYIRKNKIMESAYFLEFAKFSRDIDKFYKDITGNNTIEAIVKYSDIAWNFVHEKYLRHIPFGKELQDVFMEIVGELKELGNIPSVRAVLDKFNEIFSYVTYYYQKLQVQRNFEHFVRVIYLKIYNSETALEMENRKREAKTKFIFEPEDGYLLLEQKLPMSWHAFNETPNIQEIPEIKLFCDIYSYLATAKLSFWDYYYDYKPYTDPEQWFPPFTTNALVIGSKFFVTFDKKYYDFKADCTYLLGTDYVDRNFTILITTDKEKSERKLLLLLKNNLITIHMNKDLVEVDNTERLPVQIGGTYVFRESGILKVVSDVGFGLECNTKFEICTFEMSGWYFGKTAGLWGTYNNEASDDFAINGKTNISQFSSTWALDQTCTDSEISEPTKNNTNDVGKMCEEFFTSKISQLSTCFSRISVESFTKLCMKSRTKQEACSSAIAYIDLCDRINIPLRIPDVCVSCKLLNGTEVQEGKIFHQSAADAPKTADVVFIMEAKICNKDAVRTRNMSIVIESIEQELKLINFTDNRYSLVVFGGNGVYNEPRSVIVKGKDFTDSKSFLEYISDIPAGVGNGDIYQAIIFATHLKFRAGVSKNFILIPCSECQDDNMMHDYSTIHEVLVENSVSLHVLMNDEFTDQNKNRKILYGLDSTKAYTKRDARNLIGNGDLKNSISLPKSTLGFCFSLALETKGSVFSAKFLESQKEAAKFSTVFAKRVVRSAQHMECIDCECTATNTGMPYMDCYPCTYHRTQVDHEMDES